MLATDGKRLALHYTNYSNPVPTLQDVLYLCGPCHKNLHNEARVLPDRKRRRVADAVKGLLLALEVDMQDENFVETPRRVSSYFLEHFLEEKDSIELEEAEAAAYPSSYSGMLLESNMSANGICPHHLLPVLYTASVAYIPQGTVIGLSKLMRIARFYLSRPKLQEDITGELAQRLSFLLRTEHIGVKLEGTHLCMAVRGVRAPETRTTTSALLGAFRVEPETRAEFLSLSR